MPPINEVLPEDLLQALPVSAEEWAQTPQSVQALVAGLITRLQALEAEVARLREQINISTSSITTGILVTHRNRHPVMDRMLSNRQKRKTIADEAVVGRWDIQEQTES